MAVAPSGPAVGWTAAKGKQKSPWLTRAFLVEPGGFEPPTSCMPCTIGPSGVSPTSGQSFRVPSHPGVKALLARGSTSGQCTGVSPRVLLSADRASSVRAPSWLRPWLRFLSGAPLVVPQERMPAHAHRRLLASSGFPTPSRSFRVPRMTITPVMLVPAARPPDPGTPFSGTGLVPPRPQRCWSEDLAGPDGMRPSSPEARCSRNQGLFSRGATLATERVDPFRNRSATGPRARRAPGSTLGSCPAPASS